jgi:hypothetical protein
VLIFKWQDGKNRFCLHHAKSSAYTSAILWAIWTICLVLVKITCWWIQRIVRSMLFIFLQAWLLFISDTLSPNRPNGVRMLPFSVTLGAFNIGSNHYFSMQLTGVLINISIVIGELVDKTNTKCFYFICCFLKGNNYITRIY